MGASYLVIPQDHLSSFGKSMKQLIYRPDQGYVVPSGTSPTDTYAAAPETVKDVTYVAVNLQVTKRRSVATVRLLLTPLSESFDRTAR